MRPYQKWQLAREQFLLGELDNVGITSAALELQRELKLAKARRIPSRRSLLDYLFEVGSGYALTRAENPDAFQAALSGR